MEDKYKNKFVRIDMELGIDMDNHIYMYEKERKLSVKPKIEDIKDKDQNR